MYKRQPRGKSAGQPVLGVSVRIDGPAGDQPAGQAGEVLAKGPNIMAGYWNKPEQTAEVLQDGWYRTGDVGYLDDEGFLYLVDRAKDMIISGGENIYSTQVEAAIHKHPGVLESAVFGIPDDEWGEAVKAVVVMKPGESATEQEIIAAAAEHLASYQKPKSVDFVDSLPKAPTGKILKRKLRDPYWEAAGKQI